MNQFQKELNKNIELLRQYVPVVKKVHGPSHPEFYKVSDLFEVFDKKISSNEDVSDEFIQFREVTNNYQVPSDTCETYEAVYQMLESLDKAYQQ